MDETISKAGLARELGLTKARISQYLTRGLPVRPDGLLDRAEALRWCKEHRAPAAGGWGQGGRAMRQLKAKTAPKTLGKPASRPAPSDHESLSDYGRGVVDLGNYLREPENLAVFGELAAAHGCTAAQSYGIAQAVGVFIGVWVGDLAAAMLGKTVEETRVVRVFDEESDWSTVAAIAGESIDVKVWKAASRRAMRAWSQRAEKG